MTSLKKLEEIRDYNGGNRQTVGLSLETVGNFINKDKKLEIAINDAFDQHNALRKEFDAVLKMPEKDQITALSDGILNFYTPPTVNPYVPLAAKGPWIITTCGAVIHDSGGYGMLGQGQSPDDVLGAMSRKHVMANVMTASFSQKRLMGRLACEIGHNRPDSDRHPFTKFICMNSGSESVTVASRISDLNAKKLTDPGGKHEGKKIMFLGLRGGFHGRTDRPGQVSDSTMEKYQNLASFRDRQNLMTIPANDVQALENAFATAEQEGVFFEAMFIEPVMGEGNPGVAMTPEFYKAAREATQKMGSLLVVDSIQAGLRGTGTLSIVDYPGFENLPAPDMETYSKAINAGQYPLSILAMTEKAASLYITGIYGNTMTCNPRALDVACSVLDSVTPELRKNIVRQGHQFVEKLKALQEKHPDAITDVQGTGLLFCAHLNPKKYKVVGFGATEEYMRLNGIGVIHGGENALRFTPHFAITDDEVDLVIENVEKAIVEGPTV